MQIPEKLLSKWKTLRSKEDSAKIVQTMPNPVTPQAIRDAFRTGKCIDEIFKAMAEYYEAKAELVKQYI